MLVCLFKRGSLLSSVTHVLSVCLVKFRGLAAKMFPFEREEKKQFELFIFKDKTRQRDTTTRG